MPSFGGSTNAHTETVNKVRVDVHLGVDAGSLEIGYAATHGGSLRDTIVSANNGVGGRVVTGVIGVLGIAEDDRGRARPNNARDIVPRAVRTERSGHFSPRRGAPKGIVGGADLPFVGVLENVIDAAGQIFASDLKPAGAILKNEGIIA